MIVFLIVVLVLVLGVVVAVVAGKVGADEMSAPSGTSSFTLPDGPLGERGVDTVRFEQSLRGYNMAQVDAVLDRLFDEIRDLRSAGARPSTPPSARDDAEVSSRRHAREERDADIVQFRRRSDDGQA